jgi:hypothetical protein
MLNFSCCEMGYIIKFVWRFHSIQNMQHLPIVVMQENDRNFVLCSHWTLHFVDCVFVHAQIVYRFYSTLCFSSSTISFVFTLPGFFLLQYCTTCFCPCEIFFLNVQKKISCQLIITCRNEHSAL